MYVVYIILKKSLFVGTVLAYTSTAIPSIEADNNTFNKPNEVLKPFICKYLLLITM